jgi:hypothetical protein
VALDLNPPKAAIQALRYRRRGLSRPTIAFHANGPRFRLCAISLTYGLVGILAGTLGAYPRAHDATAPDHRARLGAHRRSPFPAAQNLALGRARQFSFDAVAFGAQVVDFVQHPVEQGLRRACRYPGALELPDLASLPMDLRAHAFDLATNKIDVWHLPIPSNQVV